MRILQFSTDAVPAERRLPLFRAGAAAYLVDTLGDPIDFAASWRVLVLGDVNVVHATVPLLRYRRPVELIEADGIDRVVAFLVRRGRIAGILDGASVAIGPGEGMVWDLSRPLDMAGVGSGTVEVVAVTIPRHMLAEVLPAGIAAGALPAGPAMDHVVEHLDYLFDHAEALPDEGAPFQGRALRDMLAVAMLPLHRAEDGAGEADAPLLGRIRAAIDEDLAADHDVAGLAQRLSLPTAIVANTVTRFGGVDEVVEQRRLLAAYRLLCDPSEAMSVSVIAARCGFTDLPRFSRRFRAVFQMTATDLRLYRSAHLPVWAGAYHLEQGYQRLLRKPVFFSAD